MKDNMAVENGPSGTHQPLSYSYPKHRALIAARCAANKRPFNSVADPYYIQEVEMLRPGTKLPSPTTVSRDIKAMYSIGAEVVREYFSVCNIPHIDFGMLVLTSYPETQWCCPSCDGWMDVTNPSMLPRNCGNLVLSWAGPPLHSRVRPV